jgi:hypothetical protein
MSKSKAFVRSVNCALSTVVIRGVMPSRDSAPAKMSTICCGSFAPCVEQDLEGEGRPSASFITPSCTVQPASAISVERAGDVGAVPLGPVADGERVALHRAGQEIGRVGLQHLAHAALGGPRRHPEHRVREVGGDPLPAARVQRLVDELEVEGRQHRLAHPPVGEEVAARVHHEPVIPEGRRAG